MRCLLGITLLFASQLSLAATSPWQALAAKNTQSHHYTLDSAQMSQQLQEGQVALPDLQQAMLTFKVRESQVFAPDLAARYPHIQTYELLDANDRVVGSLELSHQRLRAQYRTDNGIVWMTPNTDRYQLSAKTRAEHYQELTPRIVEQSVKPAAKANARPNDGIRRYRIAFATTGEYFAKFGSTDAVLAEFATILNRLNPLFRREMSAEFELIADAEKGIFTDAATDPFENSIDSDIDIIDTALANAGVPVSSYDIAHLLGTFGGGLAYVGLVCNDTYKALAGTGSDNPRGEQFYIDYLAHEIGHQFGAEHTFNAQETGDSNCSSGQRSGDSAWEPGSGSTIMSYAGICDAQNIQNSVDDYFHYGSILQYYAALDSRQAGQCGETIVNGNQVPEIESMADYVIPANSPFVLTGTATDADGDTLSYQWEQYDTGAATTTLTQMNSDNGSNPLFRSLPASDEATRYFPALSSVISGSLSRGEVYPTTARNMNFRFVVRDGQGGMSAEPVVVRTVTTASPIEITSPAAASKWQVGKSASIRWQTGGTQLAPVSCGFVDILLSTDNGVSFPSILASATPNDGEHQLTATPNRVTSSARLMLKCADNIFYSVSAQPFAIEAATATVTPSSGGGGGALGLLGLLSVLAVFLRRYPSMTALFGVLALTGCQSSVADTGTKNHQIASPTASGVELGDAENPYDVLWQSPEQAALIAIARGDLRLWKIARREGGLPGIEAQEASLLLQTCGTRTLPISGDTLRIGEKNNRSAMLDYAKRYNATVKPHCAAKAK